MAQDIDPWAWTNQQSKAPLSNSVQFTPSAEATPMGQAKEDPIVAALKNKAVDKSMKEGENVFFPKSPLGGAPVSDAAPSFVAPTEVGGTALQASAVPAGNAVGSPIGVLAAGAPEEAAGALGTAATAAPVAAETALAGTAATTAAPAALGTMAGAAAPLAAMGPLGWGVLGLMAAKQFKLI